MDEKFQIPGVAGIIENQDTKEKEILIQERAKADAPWYGIIIDKD
jgi:hypothetical protein